MTINKVMIALGRENREGADPEMVAKWCSEVDGWIARKIRGAGHELAAKRMVHRGLRDALYGVEEGERGAGGAIPQPPAAAAPFTQGGLKGRRAVGDAPYEDEDEDAERPPMHPCEGLKPYRYPEDGDRELLAEAPWDEMYFYYVCAMIDLRKRQYSDYNNETELYNSLYSDYARHWRREHAVRDRKTVRWF